LEPTLVFAYIHTHIHTYIHAYIHLIKSATEWEQYFNSSQSGARTKQELELELKKKFVASRSKKTVEGINPGALAALNDRNTTTIKALDADEVKEQLSIFEALFKAESGAAKEGEFDRLCQCLLH
jgi:hypothetical protein